jgi:hypothetical protein
VPNKCVCVCDGENDKKEESISNDGIERWRRIVVVLRGKLKTYRLTV